MPVQRIYADFNGMVRGPVDPERWAVVVDTAGSIRDLSNAGIVLEEGMALIAYDESDEDEDLEGHGTVRYDRLNAWWVVEFDETGVRNLPAGDRSPVTRHACVSCGEDVADRLASITENLRGLCPLCGAPLRPPGQR